MTLNPLYFQHRLDTGKAGQYLREVIRVLHGDTKAQIGNARGGLLRHINVDNVGIGCRQGRCNLG